MTIVSVGCKNEVLGTCSYQEVADNDNGGTRS